MRVSVCGTRLMLAGEFGELRDVGTGAVQVSPSSFEVKPYWKRWSVRLQP